MAKFKVYKFKDKKVEGYTYILATNEELAQLKLKQITHRPFKCVGVTELGKIETLKAFVLNNTIKPFE